LLIQSIRSYCTYFEVVVVRGPDDNNSNDDDDDDEGRTEKLQPFCIFMVTDG
jgi:hypothetical protein